MEYRIRRFLILLCVGFVLVPLDSFAKTLNIYPVTQQTPEWCWAAASEMVLKYYHFPNLNPGGNYQCGVVGAQGGYCAAQCALCLGAGGTTDRIAAVIQAYQQYAEAFTRFSNPDFNPTASGLMSEQEIIDSIDADAPIIAGISPTIPFPKNLGFSQHAVVIVGYEGDADDLKVVFNDPYPYPPFSNPYVQAGGKELRYGRYELSYQTFVDRFDYGNSITFN